MVAVEVADKNVINLTSLHFEAIHLDLRPFPTVNEEGDISYGDHLCWGVPACRRQCRIGAQDSQIKSHAMRLFLFSGIRWYGTWKIFHFLFCIFNGIFDIENRIQSRNLNDFSHAVVIDAGENE